MGERADEMRDPVSNRRIDDPASPQEPVPSIESTEQQDPDEIRHEIERTRAEMGETIDAIQDRLSPERLREKVRENTIGRAQEMAESATGYFRAVRSDLVEGDQPASEVARQELERGRVRIQEIQEENPRLLPGLGLGLLALVLLVVLMRRRGSAGSDEAEAQVFVTRVYKGPWGNIVHVRQERK
jgi:hypothetical protein